MKLAKVLMLCAGIVSLSACKKDDSSSPTPAGPNNIPVISTANGVLVAVKTNTWITFPVVGTVNQPVGIPVAVFYDAAGSSTLVDAGTVNCEDSLLSKQSNSSYLFTQSAYNSTGVDFNTGNSKWVVTGNTSTGVPAVNFTTTIGFPVIDSISNTGTVSTSASLTLSSSGAIMNADSIIYTVSGTKGQLQKTTSGGIASVTFTAAEMGTVGKGSGSLTIAPYRFQPKTIDSKLYYFINETVSTKVITLN
ncbi:hypothetical protein BH11BAC2_BH11BAC2_25310 [soil metagenome]